MSQTGIIGLRFSNDVVARQRLSAGTRAPILSQEEIDALEEE